MIQVRNVKVVFTGAAALLLCLVISANSISAQNVAIEPVMEQGESWMTYPGPESGQVWSINKSGGTLRASNPDLELDNVLSFDFSPDFRHLAVLQQEETARVRIFNRDGYEVARYSDVGDVDAADPSLKIFMLMNGAIAIRDNIAGFTIYNLSDLFVSRVSTASGSPDGELMSRLASSDDGRFVYVYSPRIIRGDGQESQISRLHADGELETIFTDGSMEIVSLAVADDGDSVYAVFSGDNGAVFRHIDHEGEVLSELQSEIENPRAFIQPGFGTITWYRDNSAQVYDIASGERLANAFLRNRNIVLASFDPEDQLVVTLTGGRRSADRLIQVTGISVVDLDARRIINSDEVELTMNYTDDVQPGIAKTGPNAYFLTGVTNALRIQVNR